MREARCDRHLSRERVPRASIRDKSGPKDLDRDFSARPSISRPIHLVAPSATESLDDHEVFVDRRTRPQSVFQHAKA